MYARLRRHFQFQTRKCCFLLSPREIQHQRVRYGHASPAFDNLANLFVPATVDACYQHDGTGFCPTASKTTTVTGTPGHRDRIVRVDEAALATFAQLYDEPGTPAQPRPPACFACLAAH